MRDPITWLVLLPLLWATLAFILGPGRGGRIALVALAVQCALVLWLARELGVQGARIQQAGGWPAPLGIELAADGLSVIMLLLAQVVTLLLAIYARAYFSAHGEGVQYFWPLAGCLSAAMNALFLSADIFNLYVTLELITLAAVGLVAAKGDTGAVTAALRYLLAALAGSGAYLLGVALLYAAYGSVSLRVLAPLIAADAPWSVALAAGLMLAGLLVKTALFPFHFWLPPAHGGAPSPVSALLSALVIKSTFYLSVRLWLLLFLPLATPAAAQVPGFLGAAAVLWGSFMALRQTRLKLLVAYSTVAQIGYLFLFFPLVASAGDAGAHSALQGATMQAVAHGMAKAAMFAAAGAVTLSTGNDEVARLGGVAARIPLTLFTFALAGVTLMGLPPSSGFIAKWLLIDGAITGGRWPWVAVLLAGGLLTALYVFKVLRHAFLRSEQSQDFQPLPRMLEWPAFILALGSVLLGLRSGDLLALLEVQ